MSLLRALFMFAPYFAQLVYRFQEVMDKKFLEYSIFVNSLCFIYMTYISWYLMCTGMLPLSSSPCIAVDGKTMLWGRAGGMLAVGLLPTGLDGA